FFVRIAVSLGIFVDLGAGNEFGDEVGGTLFHRLRNQIAALSLLLVVDQFVDYDRRYFAEMHPGARIGEHLRADNQAIFAVGAAGIAPSNDEIDSRKSGLRINPFEMFESFA